MNFSRDILKNFNQQIYKHKYITNKYITDVVRLDSVGILFINGI